MKQRHYQQYLARKRKKERENAFALRWEFAETANCPIHECLVPQGLFEDGIGNLAFSRRLPDGRIALAMFLLDVFCLGVKNAFGTTLPRAKYEDRIHDWRGPEIFEPMPPACLRKLVEGGVAYARELGFSPHPDYAVASQIFGDVDASACSTEFTYGREGKPFYCSGPNETAAQARAIVDTLAQRLGAKGFDCQITIVASPDELG
jgi:hypothetical protein